jgi:hypothetical protein
MCELNRGSIHKSMRWFEETWIQRYLCNDCVDLVSALYKKPNLSHEASCQKLFSIPKVAGIDTGKGDEHAGPRDGANIICQLTREERFEERGMHLKEVSGDCSWRQTPFRFGTSYGIDTTCAGFVGEESCK